MLVLTALLGYVIPRSDFFAYIGANALFWGFYVYLITRQDLTARELKWYIGLGIALRVLLLFSIPNLSDDFYRFLWDGRLAVQGIHPFAHPPSWFIKNQMQVPGITPDLFHQLNSPEYFTVYPPVCQAVFWLAVKLFPESVAGGVFIMKLFLLGCEIGTIFVLAGSQTLAGKSRLWYALNPLAILEITGNCHFEGAMLCFLLAGLYAMQRGRDLRAACWWALATASKLVPLLFLPIVLVRLGWKRGSRFGLAFTAAAALLFLPLLDLTLLSNITGSLNLYFRQFEFNASIYYVLKSIGAALTPPKTDVARTLGPVLGLVVLLGVLGMAFFLPRRHGGAENLLLWKIPDSTPPFLRGELVLALALYLVLATTVHPWYIVPLFGLSLLTPWRFPLVWSATAALSYSHYAGGHFQENYLLIGLEYALVAGAAWWDYRRLNPSSSPR